ncbi:MAG: hypothetical protein OEV00_07385, partial [Acidobacteriota bacterium]|nr:hypothetical protein [Acidobacteriota bacterium]
MKHRVGNLPEESNTSQSCTIARKFETVTGHDQIQSMIAVVVHPQCAASGLHRSNSGSNADLLEVAVTEIAVEQI